MKLLKNHSLLITTLCIAAILNSTEKASADITYSVTDLHNVVEYMSGIQELSQDQIAGYDQNSDSIINIIDFILLKSNLVENDNSIYVSDTQQIHEALSGASAGDIIKVMPGTYNYHDFENAQKFYSSSDGTAQNPIILTCADKEKPPVLTGTNLENGYVLHITGDYWIIDGIKTEKSQKGIVLDNSNHSIIRNCEISATGSEGVHFRDGSSYCTIENSYIHDTGLVSPKYGEGVYVGSAYSTTGYKYECDYNKIISCTFKNVAAEDIDIKEYTTGTEVTGCTFYGEGISGENYAGSFIDIKGNDCIVSGNTGYRQNNKNIVAAFELHKQVEGWGYNAVFENNTLYLDREYGEIDTSRRIYVVDGYFSTYTVKNNMVDYGNGLVECTRDYLKGKNITFI